MGLPETASERREMGERIDRVISDTAATFSAANPDTPQFEVVIGDKKTGEHFWAKVRVEELPPLASPYGVISRGGVALQRLGIGHVPSVANFVDSMVLRSADTALVCDAATAAVLGQETNPGTLVTCRILERPTGHLPVHIVRLGTQLDKS